RSPRHHQPTPTGASDREPQKSPTISRVLAGLPGDAYHCSFTPTSRTLPDPSALASASVAFRRSTAVSSGRKRLTLANHSRERGTHAPRLPVVPPRLPSALGRRHGQPDRQLRGPDRDPAARRDRAGRDPVPDGPAHR